MASAPSPHVGHPVPAAGLAAGLAGLLGLLLLTSALAPAAHGAAGSADRTRSAQARSSQAALTTTEYERRLQHWTNVQRRRHGLRAVRLDGCADGYAERWTRHLVRSGGELVHRDQSVVLEGCNASAAGEVLARGQVSPRRMVSMWMHSSGHRAILLSRTYRRIGLGAMRMRDGSWLATGNYLRR
jgi:uncharacterized protein YkwD